MGPMCFQHGPVGLRTGEPKAPKWIPCPKAIHVPRPQSWLAAIGLAESWVAIFAEKKAPAASWLAGKGPIKSWVIIFTKEKMPAASWLAATGLVKSWVVNFTEIKAPAARSLAATGLVKFWVAVFTEKSPCGKLVSSHRACQSRDHGCIMDFDNHKVAFRTDRIPLHRIAVQFSWAELFGE